MSLLISFRGPRRRQILLGPKGGRNQIAAPPQLRRSWVDVRRSSWGAHNPSAGSMDRDFGASRTKDQTIDATYAKLPNDARHNEHDQNETQIRQTHRNQFKRSKSMQHKHNYTNPIKICRFSPNGSETHGNHQNCALRNIPASQTGANLVSRFLPKMT